MLLLALTLVTGQCRAQGTVNLITNGDFAEGTQGWRLHQAATCEASVVETGGGGFATALHLETNPQPGADPWSIVLQRDVEAFIEEGDRLELRVWMRSPTGNTVSAYLEIPREPYSKPLNTTFELTPDWQEYVVEGVGDAAYSPGGLVVGFHLGSGPGTIEITGVRVLDLDLQGTRERATVDKPQSLIENGDLIESLDGNWGRPEGERLRAEVIDAAVGGYAKAARLTSNPEPGAPPWNVQWGQSCGGYVYKGDAVYFQAWLRSPDRCPVTLIWELAQAPHTKAIDQKVTLTPDWQECRFLGRAFQGFRPGESRVAFFLGHQAGAVEVAGIRVESYGTAPDSAFDQTIDYWGGREHNDDWRAPALERIERIRKGDLTISVVDADGNPVPECTLRVQQQRHHFRFGTAAPAARFVDQTDPDNLRFQQEVERLFNTVTFENDLKYAAAGPQRLELVDRATDWLRDRDIDVRGHCLLWGSYQHLAPSVRDLRGEALLQACQDHVIEYASHMQGNLYLWDVVNEAGSNTEVWDEIGWESFADSFRWAREADPDVLLCYNDYGIVNLNPGYREQVRKRIEYLIDHDAPLDVLGIQGHMHLPLTPMHTVLEILDEWAEFGKDLEITEFDIGIQEDEMHAQYVRDFMTAVFSHPQVTAFIQWGFWEGSHWRGRDGGAMFRRDWSKRPAQEAYEDLVLNQWWTNEERKTGTDGAATVRVFYGQHEVTVEHDGARKAVEVELLPDQPDAGVVKVQLP